MFLKFTELLNTCEINSFTNLMKKKKIKNEGKSISIKLRKGSTIENVFFASCLALKNTNVEEEIH